MDEKGYALTSRFSAIRPKPGGPSALLLWAIMNSPIANAFAHDMLGKRDLLVGTMRTMPVPERSSSQEAAIESAAFYYRELATSCGPLFRQESTPEGIRQAILAMDAAVLRAYALPPRLERQLLDVFSGVERKGVGLDGPDGRSTFRGYYPPGFNSALPLYMLISDRFERAAADKTAERFKPGESAYVRDMLSAASVGTREA